MRARSTLKVNGVRHAYNKHKLALIRDETRRAQTRLRNIRDARKNHLRTDNLNDLESSLSGTVVHRLDHTYQRDSTQELIEREMLNESTLVQEECNPDDLVGRVIIDIENGKVTKDRNVTSIQESAAMLR